MEHFEPNTRTACADFIANTEQGLLLCGPAGTGKTHLAVAVMKATFRPPDPEEESPRQPELFVTVPQLLMEIRGTFKNTPAQSESELIARYAGVPMLVLDDLGAEKGSEYATQTLYLIIDRRYSEMRRTIITSNLSVGEIAEKVGDRIASRIAGMCKVIELKGKDRRIGRPL